MRLTKRLLGYLNRVFSKDPARVLALQISYQEEMAWEVQDGILTTTVSSGQGTSLTIDLSQYTFATLVDFIAAQPGYTTPFLNASAAGISALALLDATGDISQSNGGNLYAYTSALYAYLEANAAELELAAQQIKALPAEMSTTTADTIWLDFLGTYYKVPRLPNEPDAAYGPRIIAQVLRPMGNNVAMEIAISTFTGQVTTVTDVVTWGSTTNLYNGASTHNGAIDYSASAVPLYGLFDVEYGYDIINGSDITSFAATVTSLINTLRDAGTHLRSLALQGSDISDSLTAPTDGEALSLELEYSASDELTAPTDSSSTMLVDMGGLADSLTAPDDSNAELITVSYNYEYSGLRSYNGAIQHLGGQVVTETH
jgi:hypothetical protein